jgi:tetratricopeptide (TPR) repeat protein
MIILRLCNCLIVSSLTISSVQASPLVSDLLSQPDHNRSELLLAEEIEPSPYDIATQQANIASNHLENGRLEEALEILKSIASQDLIPFADFPSPKDSMLDQILDQALDQGNFSLAQTTALVYEKPEHQVKNLRKIAHAYLDLDSKDQGLTILDQALAITHTIEEIVTLIVREADGYYMFLEPNTKLLINLASDYAQFGAKDQSLATLNSAVASTQYPDQYYVLHPRNTRYNRTETRTEHLLTISEMYLELGECQSALDVLKVSRFFNSWK